MILFTSLINILPIKRTIKLIMVRLCIFYAYSVKPMRNNSYCGFFVYVMKTKVRFPYKLSLIAVIDWPNGTFYNCYYEYALLHSGFPTLLKPLSPLSTLFHHQFYLCIRFYFVFTCFPLPLTHIKEVIKLLKTLWNSSIPIGHFFFLFNSVRNWLIILLNCWKVIGFFFFLDITYNSFPNKFINIVIDCTFKEILFIRS